MIYIYIVIFLRRTNQIGEYIKRQKTIQIVNEFEFVRTNVVRIRRRMVGNLFYFPFDFHVEYAIVCFHQLFPFHLKNQIKGPFARYFIYDKNKRK